MGKWKVVRCRDISHPDHWVVLSPESTEYGAWESWEHAVAEAHALAAVYR